MQRSISEGGPTSTNGSGNGTRLCDYLDRASRVEVPMFSKSLMAIKLFGNVALFVPFGISLQLILRRQIWVTVAAGLTTSLCVEVLQYLLVRGTSSTGDLILNCAGALVGAGVSCLSVDLRSKMVSSMSL